VCRVSCRVVGANADLVDEVIRPLQELSRMKNVCRKKAGYEVTRSTPRNRLREEAKGVEVRLRS
jgi:hypothetical protein